MVMPDASARSRSREARHSIPIIQINHTARNHSVAATRIKNSTVGPIWIPGVNGAAR